MSVTLGPGIIAHIFDGIERPLRDLKEATGAFIGEGCSVPTLDETKKYSVTIKVKPGDHLTGGDIYATCPESGIVQTDADGIAG